MIKIIKSDKEILNDYAKPLRVIKHIVKYEKSMKDFEPHQQIFWRSTHSQYIGKETEFGELSFYLRDFLKTGKIS